MTCGGGAKNQIRFCAKPAPGNGGLDCEGPSQQTASCSEWDCPTIGKLNLFYLSTKLRVGIIALVDGGWTKWLDASLCSVSCGGGIKNQTRFCSSPGPENGGLDCQGLSEQMASCNEWDCPVIGQLHQLGLSLNVPKHWNCYS